jgi:hypothetical protein
MLVRAWPPVGGGEMEDCSDEDSSTGIPVLEPPQRDQGEDTSGDDDSEHIINPLGPMRGNYEDGSSEDSEHEMTQLEPRQGNHEDDSSEDS